MSQTETLPDLQSEPTPPLAPISSVKSSPLILRSGRTTLALILREMSTRYGRSPGGYLWALLEPLGGMLIMAIGFSLMVRSPPLGTSFLLFFATGIVPFGIFQNLSRSVGNALNYSKALLKFPAVTWVEALLARFLLNALTNILVMGILITGTIIVAGLRIRPDFEPVLIATALLCLQGVGWGALNAALGGLLPIWNTVWSIATRPLFIASGVFFLYGDLPPAVQDVLWYNPIMHVLDLFRTGFYPTYHPNHVSILYILITGLVPLFFGVLLLGRYHRFILSHR